MAATTKTLYEVRITLTGAKPAVWRRVRVDPDRSLGDLHRVIQSAMGWGDGHLHAFEQKKKGVKTRRFCLQSEFFGEFLEEEDEEAVTLREVCPRVKDTLSYEYDFGDSWRHKLTVSKVVNAETNQPTPACLSGKGACPPEDCGGVWGYRNLLDSLADPTDPEHAELKEGWGDGLDPEAFSLEEVNGRLKWLRREAAEPAQPARAGDAGVVWRAYLGEIDVDGLVDAAPEAAPLREARPPGGFPGLWYIAYEEEGADGPGGLGFTQNLAEAAARAETGVRTLCEGSDGAASLPGVLRVNDARMAGWFAGLEAEGVRVEVAEGLDGGEGIASEAREELLLTLLGAVTGEVSLAGPGGGGSLDASPMSSGPGVTDADVRDFYAAAATLAEAEAWDRFPAGDFVEVVRPEPPEGMKLFSVFLGEDGCPSINFVKSVEVAEAMLSPQTDEQLLQQLSHGMWSVDFLSPDGIFTADLDEADRLDLPSVDVDGLELLPTLSRFDGTEVGRATGERLRFVTALMRAMAVPPEPTIRSSLGLRSRKQSVGEGDGGFAFRPLDLD